MKSIFVKYILVFTSILLVSFLMLTSIISTTLGNYYDQEVKRELEQLSGMLSGLISLEWREGEFAPAGDELPLGNSSGTKGNFDAMVNEVTKTLPEYMEFLITDKAGRVVVASLDLGDGADLAVSDRVVSALLSDPEYDYSDLSDLGGVLSQRYQVYGKAIFFKDKPGGMVFAYYNGLEATLYQTMNRATFMSSLWIMLAALVVVYFVSDRLVRPIRSMSNAVKSFAKGNFDERVPVIGNDEVAELAEGFNQMADSLAQMEKMRNSFLASVSHDLRTPMTAIAGFIDGINSGAIPPDKQGYYLDIISAEIHRLSRLVTQILDVSRLASGER